MSEFTAADLAKRFTWDLGDVGRGYRMPQVAIDKLIPQLTIAGFKPYVVPGMSAHGIACLDAGGEPTGWMWFGYAKDIGEGSGLVVGFEVPVASNEVY